MWIESIYFLLSLAAVSPALLKHEPQVYENLDEPPLPQYVRLPRHLGKAQANHFQHPSFNYQPTPQPDRLKARYHRQQQADIRNLKIATSPRPFDEEDNDWKPFQPKFVPFRHTKDLHEAASEIKEEVASSDRQDTQYVYVDPNLLKKNFGLDSATTQKILENSAPTTERAEVSGLKELLGQSPSAQLQGLQKLLDAKPAVEVDHNGSPSLTASDPQLDALQKHLDAVNKAQAEQVLAAAQKQAQAHVQAQHEAIARAQKQAQEEAFAKIAAHNQGAARPAPEVSALQERPFEQVLVNPGREYSGHYASSSEDLRNAKPIIPGRFFQPGPAKLQFLGAPPQLYGAKEVQTYSPVSPYTPHLTPKIQPTEATLIPSGNYGQSLGDQHVQQPEIQHVPQIQHVQVPEIQHVQIPEGQHVHIPQLHQDNQEVVPETYHHQQLRLAPEVGKQQQLYIDAEEGHQYAAKYAFGYRVLDEKQGNDFGHEEARDGKLTKGRYFVTLPDGRKQNVEYYSDKSGYHARVSYENVGIHPYVPNQLEEHNIVEEEPEPNK